MSNPVLVKAYKASADILPNSFVASTDGETVQMVAGTNVPVLGVCELGGKSGDIVDVVLMGIAEVRVTCVAAQVVGTTVSANTGGGGVPYTGGTVNTTNISWFSASLLEPVPANTTQVVRVLLR